ncbi:hypothetical protein SDC9_47475 [bioreactor metagenome]|uniref:Uncharacterized protein n=1 Tax=bioreactor metagenome TaxID=1076179 RepID=A0A644WCH1_9ZZZZ|nr:MULTISPECIES: hypothetical protein [Bacteria]
MDLAYGICIAVVVVIFIFNSTFKGINDEASNQILSKANEKSLNFLFLSIFVVGMIATTSEVSGVFKSVGILGVVIMFILLCFTIFRFALFTHYDRKGIFD